MSAAQEVQWHPTLNNGLLETEMTPTSRRRAWWLREAGHEFEMTIALRNDGQPCPKCDTGHN